MFSISIINKSLVAKYFVMYLLQIFFLFFVYLKFESLYLLFFFLNIIIPILIYFTTNKYSDKIILLVFLFFATPMSSIEINILFPQFGDYYHDQIIFTDRLRAGIIPAIIFALFLYLKGIFRLLNLGRGLYFLIMLIIPIVLLFIFTSHNFVGLSLYQVYIDFFYLLSILAIIIFFNVYKGRYYILYKEVINLFEVFVFFVVVDLSLTLSGLTPWAISVRGGIAGNFYGLDVSFSIAILISGIYLVFFKFVESKWKLIIIVLTIVFLYLTFIKSALGAFIMVLVFNYRALMFRYLNKFVMVFLMILILFLSWNLVINKNKSLGARIGTYIVYIDALAKNIITGVMPGVTQNYMKSNLAIKVFGTNYSQSLRFISNNDAIAKELMKRQYENKNNRGAFLPHNTYLVFIAAFGLIGLPILFYFFIPIYFILNKQYRPKEYNFLVLLIISLFIMSLTHASLLFVEMIFLSELLRKLRSDNQLKIAR
jgi:hypothetical protein